MGITQVGTVPDQHLPPPPCMPREGDEHMGAFSVCSPACKLGMALALLTVGIVVTAAGLHDYTSRQRLVILGLITFSAGVLGISQIIRKKIRADWRLSLTRMLLCIERPVASRQNSQRQGSSTCSVIANASAGVSHLPAPPEEPPPPYVPVRKMLYLSWHQIPLIPLSLSVITFA